MLERSQQRKCLSVISDNGLVSVEYIIRLLSIHECVWVSLDELYLQVPRSFEGSGVSGDKLAYLQSGKLSHAVSGVFKVL